MKMFIEPQSLKGIIEGLLFMNFEHPMISVKVEMQSPDNSELIDEKPVSFPTVVNEGIYVDFAFDQCAVHQAELN